MQRRIVRFHGRVQGVGFRYTVSEIARGFDVSGYVMNCPDGTVELVTEGEAREIGAFIAEIRNRMSHFIRDVNILNAPTTGEFGGFRIKYG